ncbi:hypothetical protein NX786_00730 [Telluria mixta]|uniref:ATP-binding protein n=2 Tax=Telluria mixta TaxID=34071 RepID=A0ABT2BSA1_9BURK|nr:hypothetical protein [Telluria mixta]MCS0627872.1 hypothetical protein [Telluria mixta]
MQVIADAFLNTRADHLPDDLYKNFIVPPFFRRISIFTDPRSVRILGGRGCGKTMFIRYFCHATTFSPKRLSVADSEIGGIGLYFRPDTGFCALMSPEWLGERVARLAFSHYVALSLLLEARRAVRSLEKANLSDGPLPLEGGHLGRSLVKLLELSEPSLDALETRVCDLLDELELWVRNPRQRPEPTFISFASVIPKLGEDLSGWSARMTSIAFRSFIDEFENLQPAHREVICDAIKHPHKRLTVHIAHKRDAVTDFKTSSDERIVLLHDLRSIDLEEVLQTESEFELLAAELFLLRLHEANATFHCPMFDPEKLHDIKDLEYRLSDQYRKEVLRCVREILPVLSAPEISRIVVSDAPLRRRLRDYLQKGLQLQKEEQRYTPDDLISDTSPEASIVLGALLNRRSQKAVEIIAQFQQSTQPGKDRAADPFYKVGGWVDNNLYGCLFHLFAGLPRRANILYAGFERYCRLASPNLRFFQELCHTALLLAFQRQSADRLEGQLRVDPEKQAIAAKQVSEALFQDILELGSHGARLLEIANRLGRVFEAFNRRRSQSEAEINHFSIDQADQQDLSPVSKELIREAKVWSVLYEEKDTKNKSDYDVSQSDLVLNRIYTPRFNISYRKRKKITLRAGEVDVIFLHSSAQFELLLKTLVEPDDTNRPQTSDKLF